MSARVTVPMIVWRGQPSTETDTAIVVEVELVVGSDVSVQRVTPALTLTDRETRLAHSLCQDHLEGGSMALELMESFADVLEDQDEAAGRQPVTSQTFELRLGRRYRTTWRASSDGRLALVGAWGVLRDDCSAAFAAMEQSARTRAMALFGGVSA